MHNEIITIIFRAGNYDFFREPRGIFINFIKLSCISNSRSLDSLHKFEVAAGEFKEVLCPLPFSANFEP